MNGLEGVINISDDILVFAETKTSHDKRLRALLTRLSELNLTLNVDKCAFSINSVVYFGMVFSDKGMSPDPKKVSAIRDCKQPDTVSAVKSFLGMTSYLSRFISNYSTVTAPLRDLIRNRSGDMRVAGLWQNCHAIAFESIKGSLSTESALSYYDENKEIELIVYASPIGVAAVLTKKNKDNSFSVLPYASRALTDVEKRYPQVHREALGLMWGILHFAVYLRGGKQFKVLSDNNTVVHIFNNPSSSPPPRIERMVMKIQQFCFKVVHRAGKDNPAAFLSRHPERDSPMPIDDIEDHVNFVARSCVPKSMSFDEVAQATAIDSILQRIIYILQNRSYWTLQERKNENLLPYYLVRNELSTVGAPAVLLKGKKLVIPRSLQNRVLQLAHTGHQGMNKTKALLREKVWFCGIDKAVERMIKDCVECQSVCAQPRCEPLRMTQLPDRPWQKVSCDFKGPIANGDYLIVLLDEYSRFPVVDIVKSTNANSVIPVLDRIMSEFGIVETLKTDNGPPFQSEAFANFASEIGFKHRRITPLWPAANGLVENFMKGLSKIIKISVGHNKPFVQLLHNFLRDYRSTPHLTTDYSPFYLLFGRSPRTRLPELVETDHSHSVPDDVIVSDYKHKERQKEYADRKRRAIPSLLAKGDSVLVKQTSSFGKSEPRFADPAVVEHRKGSLVTVVDKDGRKTVRNASFFTPIPTSASTRQCDVPVPTCTSATIGDDKEMTKRNLDDSNNNEYQSVAEGRSRREVKKPERYGFPTCE